MILLLRIWRDVDGGRGVHVLGHHGLDGRELADWGDFTWLDLWKTNPVGGDRAMRTWLTDRLIWKSDDENEINEFSQRPAQQ